jgi:hypothetical protein
MISFNTACVLDEADVRAALDELVARKQVGDVLAVAPPVEALSRFIETELPLLEESYARDAFQVADRNLGRCGGLVDAKSRRWHSGCFV